MFGALCPQVGGAVRVERMRIAGMGVLCAWVNPVGRGERRRLAKAERLLRCAGVTRILPCKDYKPQISLPSVTELPLYRTLADRLVLTVLAGRGISPEQATVVLRGEYPDPDLTAAAYRLCPLLRQVVIDTQRGGARLQQGLYRTFGVTVGPASADTVIRVRFSGAPAGEELQLCEGAMPVGLVTVPELELPNTLERGPMLCALWQAGCLNLERFQVGEK